MCLTEPQAGSDVGALNTRAERQADGTYRLFGQKIFITWGEHDLTENIVHLVLARTPGAAPGTKGISLFLVPKFIPTADGRPGERNDLKVVSIEHKMGIHASPTCVLSFGDAGQGAVGYLIGEEQSGMRYMFTMMNTARIGVGIEGLSISEAAYQKALEFSKVRIQGRPVGESEEAEIIEHPDVRRMLLTMRAYKEALRGVLYKNAYQVDLERHAETDEERQRAAELVALFTPISKAWSTDVGVAMASVGIQVHGGMGFVEETGAAQFYRDIRIAPIYEGTNGIQAMDLVTRKLGMRNGQVVKELLDDIDRTARRASADIGDPLLEAVSAVRRATEHLLSVSDPNDALAGATPYLEMMGLLLGGWVHAQSALAAAEAGDQSFMKGRLGLARFYNTQILPRAAALLPAVTASQSQLAASYL
jgi:alkylation response protein AidB-like acyl-CoA dehydrogenase